MIKQVVIYESNGVKFDDLESAKSYDDLCKDIESIMSKMKPRTEDIEELLDYGKQDVKTVRICIKNFCFLCAKIFADYEKTFNEVANGVRHISHIGRIIYDSKYKVLHGAYFRFECINMETGYEFQQPYFTNHMEEAFEEIKARKCKMI